MPAVATEPFFVPSERGLLPSARAVGPWAGDMLHGRLLAGLAAWAIERDHGVDGFVPVRLTVDMFRNPPMEPADVATTIVRAGGRVRVMDAVVRIGGKDVARASALFLRAGEEPVDDRVAVSPAWDAPPPDELAADIIDEPGFDVMSPPDRGFGAPGPRQAWVRDRRPLIGGVELSPFVRAALAADYASPLANFGATGLDFINADLTLHLGRLPEGEWIGLETTHRVATNGVSIAVCALHDLRAPIGDSTVCAVRTARMAPDETA
jgi:Acyl-CoA thioesterase C-terminal domain/Acyl-CoA thioesterase N-terminal domain